jgi:hypothetical protein
MLVQIIPEFAGKIVFRHFQQRLDDCCQISLKRPRATRFRMCRQIQFTPLPLELVYLIILDFVIVFD